MGLITTSEFMFKRDLFEVENDSAMKSTATVSVQSCKEQIKEFMKRYSDKHKDLHASVSKIGKVIDKVLF